MSRLPPPRSSGPPLLPTWYSGREHHAAFIGLSGTSAISTLLFSRFSRELVTHFCDLHSALPGLSFFHAKAPADILSRVGYEQPSISLETGGLPREGWDTDKGWAVQHLYG